jgi:hypothetical protein
VLLLGAIVARRTTSPRADGKLLWRRREHRRRSSRAMHLPGGSRHFAHHSCGRRGQRCMGKGNSLSTVRSTVGQALAGSHHPRPAPRQADGASPVLIWRFQLTVGAVRSTGSDHAAPAGLQPADEALHERVRDRLAGLDEAQPHPGSCRPGEQRAAANDREAHLVLPFNLESPAIL